MFERLYFSLNVAQFSCEEAVTKMTLAPVSNARFANSDTRFIPLSEAFSTLYVVIIYKSLVVSDNISKVSSSSKPIACNEKPSAATAVNVSSVQHIACLSRSCLPDGTLFLSPGEKQPTSNQQT